MILEDKWRVKITFKIQPTLRSEWTLLHLSEHHRPGVGERSWRKIQRLTPEAIFERRQGCPSPPYTTTCCQVTVVPYLVYMMTADLSPSAEEDHRYIGISIRTCRTEILLCPPESPDKIIFIQLSSPSQHTFWSQLLTNVWDPLQKCLFMLCFCVKKNWISTLKCWYWYQPQKFSMA